MSRRSSHLPRIPGRRVAPGATGRDDGAVTMAAASRPATIAIYSVKGGVGKTTMAVNLAWSAAMQAHRRTLLWDLDAAGGAGFLLDTGPRKSGEAGSVFTGREPMRCIRRTPIEGLDLLPADESLRGLDAQLVRLGKRRRLAKLAAALGEEYERIVLDCPPVMNELSAQIVRAADLVIVPLPPSPLSARAFDLVVREVADQARHHPPILPVLSMLDLRRALHRQAREDNPSWPVIPYASVVEQCAVRRAPVGAIDPASPAAACFAGLWRAIEDKLATR